MLEENAKPFVSHKRKVPRSFAREFFGKSKCSGSPGYLICDNTAMVKT